MDDNLFWIIHFSLYANSPYKLLDIWSSLFPCDANCHYLQVLNYTCVLCHGHNSCNFQHWIATSEGKRIFMKIIEMDLYREVYIIKLKRGKFEFPHVNSINTQFFILTQCLKYHFGCASEDNEFWELHYVNSTNKWWAPYYKHIHAYPKLVVQLHQVIYLCMYPAKIWLHICTTRLACRLPGYLKRLNGMHIQMK